MFKGLVHLVLAYLLFVSIAYAFKMGGRWDSRENPTKNVTIELSSGEKVSGDFFIDWNGDHVLATQSGRIRVTAYRSMSVPYTGTDNRDFPWRTLLPPSLIITLYAVIVLPMLSRRGRKERP